jgi:hypothetical protein
MGFSPNSPNYHDFKILTFLAFRENPHIGCSGVPFMNKTMSFVSTIFCILERSSTFSPLNSWLDIDMERRTLNGCGEVAARLIKLPSIIE